MPDRRALIFALTAWGLSVALAARATRAAEPPVLLLWPDGAPGAVGTSPADQPSLTLYPVSGPTATGAAFVVCPGGGYGGLAVDHEGRQIAAWLNGAGISAFVLHYRHAPRYRHPTPLGDVARAVRTVRARAEEWGHDPNRIGVIGFSAGGHLTSTIGTHFDAGQPDAADPIERVNSRPNAIILGYPVISLVEPFTHAGSRKNLLGESPPSELVASLSNERQVTAETPPAFLFTSGDDAVVPVENSLAFYAACRRAGVPAELHVYQHGPHGFGLGTDDPILSTWPAHALAWLKVVGILK